MVRTILMAIAAAGALCAQHVLDLEGRYWIPQMSSRIRVEQNGFGTDIDAKNDLGMSDTNFPQGGFTWQHGRTRVRFFYTPVDYSGDRAVTRTVTFRGTQYTVGTRVVSDLAVKHLQLSWAYQFINVKDGLFRLGPLVEADGFLMHGRLTAPDFSITQKEDLSAGLPTVGLAMDISPRRMLDIYGEVSGLQVGSYGYFVSSDAGVKVRARHLLLSAGYRTFNLHVENSPDFARLRLRGPFVGAGFTF